MRCGVGGVLLILRCDPHPLSHQMARTQKNKATARHLGLLKARLAKLRAELIAPKGGGGGPGEGCGRGGQWCRRGDEQVASALTSSQWAAASGLWH